MNKPDTLEDQLEALSETGFRDVDCYYKNGIFAVFGGKMKP
jgi:tRNA (cmo5U34)-methyltransferase